MPLWKLPFEAIISAKHILFTHTFVDNNLPLTNIFFKFCPCFMTYLLTTNPGQPWGLTQKYICLVKTVYDIKLMKGKATGSIACTRKQQPRFYWSCSSVVKNDATPLTPLAHERNSIFKCKQHTCTLHDPRGPKKIWLHNDVVPFAICVYNVMWYLSKTTKLKSLKLFILDIQWYHTTSRAPAKKIHLGLFCKQTRRFKGKF